MSQPEETLSAAARAAAPMAFRRVDEVARRTRRKRGSFPNSGTSASVLSVNDWLLAMLNFCGQRDAADPAARQSDRDPPHTVRDRSYFATRTGFRQLPSLSNLPSLSWR